MSNSEASNIGRSSAPAGQLRMGERDDRQDVAEWPGLMLLRKPRTPAACSLGHILRKTDWW